MTDFYVYLYIDPTNNDEIFYVGKGIGDRYKRHLYRKDKHPFTNRLSQLKLNKIKPLIHKIYCSNEQIAFDLEIGLIKNIGRKDLQLGTLLNLTNGGDSPPRWVGKRGPLTEEHKIKLSESKKKNWTDPEYKNNMIQSHIGKVQSEETINKRTLKITGLKRTKDQRKTMSESRIKYLTSLGNK